MTIQIISNSSNNPQCFGKLAVFMKGLVTAQVPHPTMRLFSLNFPQTAEVAPKRVGMLISL